MKPNHPREQVREEPLRVAQERALALHAAKLLEEGEGQDLRVRELLERPVPVPLRVEESVGVVHEAEQHGRGPFQAGRRWGSVWVGHPRGSFRRDSDGPVLQANLALFT